MPMKTLALFLILVMTSIACENANTQVQGELKKWHRISLQFDGPSTDEKAEKNPFLDYRLDVTFKNGEKTYHVPGFYAADGMAAESSASSGNKWMVRFTPDKVGRWTYSVSFKKGENVAVLSNVETAESAGFMDGKKGSFVVEESDKKGIDNRAKGRLSYVGESYLKYEETGAYFIKLGVDAPENLLAYEDFDASTDALGLLKNWQPHEQDFEEGAKDFLWKGEKGKNLLGAINYLASEELNVFSFLTFNVDGDDRNVFPYLLKEPVDAYVEYASEKKNVEAWVNYFHRTRFDVSKMEQWERIFDYSEQKGMFLHFKTHETETDHLMDGGEFGIEGKLYYRELIARFGHHLSMNWNLGEENDQPITHVQAVAQYIKDLDPYDHHMVIHTYPNQDYRYADLIGEQSPLTGASLQLSDAEFIDVHPRVLKWKEKADSTGRKWALAVDEPGKAKIALLPDDEDTEHDDARTNAMYGTLMAGGFGVEWYFGYASPNSDLTCQDFRSRDLFWDQNRIALRFFKQHIPFWQMEPRDDLLSDERSYCLAKPDEVYAIFIHNAEEAPRIDLGDSGRTFNIYWYNTREGGDLQEGSVKSVQAKGFQEIGTPPSERDKDWLAVIK